ncbi:MAG: hypothetical protein KAT05_12345 [Spirochaetes bacterium]|nr:hypothetical protein [Spirochaetota bacterium]
MLRYIIISIVLTIVISSAVCDEKKMKIAILDFSYNESKIDKGIANNIVELFISAFIKTGAFEVIERRKLQQLMNELSLQSSDDFDDAFIQELGKLYGIETVILGNITKFGDSYNINIRGVEISSGVVIFADTLTVDSDKKIPSKIPMFVYQLLIVKSKKNISLISEMNYNKFKKAGIGTLIPGTILLGIGFSILIPAVVLFGYSEYIENIYGLWELWDLEFEELVDNPLFPLFRKMQRYSSTSINLFVVFGIASGIGSIFSIIAISFLSYARNINKSLNKNKSTMILPYFNYNNGIECGVLIKI